MDLLCNAYSTASDEDEDEDHHHRHSQRRIPEIPTLRPSKRPKPQNPHTAITNPLPFPTIIPQTQNEPPIPGRYISKRERAALAPRVSHPFPPSSVTSPPVLGNISDANIRHDIIASLRHKTKERTQFSQISRRLSIALNGHSKAVNALQWSTSHPHLLASAGMDNTVCIWNVWNRDEKQARVFSYHTAAVKDVKWSVQGLFVLSCGYDSSSRLIDVEKGLETQVFKEEQVVSVVKFHPNNSSLFLSGGSKGLVRLWDIRTGKAVHQYNRGLGPILDVEFNIDTKQFISSSDVSKGNVSENSIIVWDVTRQVPLSNQVYVEAYTCPCIRCHPIDPYFIAQSNGNYIAIFSAKTPFKLDKYKRYESHGVSGFPIKCNFSLDGEKLATGSSDGCIYFYNTKNTDLIRKIKVYEHACIDVAFHPIMPNVIASCSWNGDVSVSE
ncbi:hypothetical protein LguiA_023214 [Lonicera macranthoides]